MKLTILEIKSLAHVDLAIYTVDGVKCASFVKRGELPTLETESAEAQLIAAGGDLWEKHGKRRIYFNNLHELQGLWVRYSGGGNVIEARLNGEKISNAAAKRFQQANAGSVFFDLNTNEWDDDAAAELVLSKLEEK
jgi:hypothetical protein